MSWVERIAARSPAQRRVLAVLILVVAVLLAWSALIAPLGWLIVSQDQWRTEVRHELARARGRAGSEPELRKRLAALPAAPVWSRFYIPVNGQDVSSLVQRDVMSIGTGAGVTLQAIVTVPKVTAEGLTGYGIRFSASMGADQLKKLMDALRANTRYLRVERLGVTAPQLQDPEQNSALTVTMEVYGYTHEGAQR